jgi:acetyltransferase-like isoleucine patch superfamily enzyme
MWIKKSETIWISDDVEIEGKVTFKEGTLLTTVNNGTKIIGTVNIGEGVLISFGCLIASASHGIALGKPIRQQETINKRVTIGDDVWVGAGSIILGGCHLKRGCVIGAGSLLLEDTVVGENEVWVGSPAKFLKVRTVFTK